MQTQNNTTRQRRMRALWRTRACAAGLCVGTQLFLSGCAVGMPLALSSAWLAAIPVFPFAAWLTARSRRALTQTAGKAIRLGYAFLFAALLGCAGFALLSMTAFAAQTLAQQAQALWLEATALAAAALCACCGSTGATRLSFALRYCLPLLVLGLSVAALPMRVPAGLFPILGAGAKPLALAALAMLFGAAPALMLMLPPQMTKDEPPANIPSARFFLVRVLCGALGGALLLFLTSACTTYESIAQSMTWGARLRMAAGNQPHEGVLQMFLTLFKLMAMLLLAANMLCAARHALGLAFPRLKSGPAGTMLCTALLAALLLMRSLFGDAPALLAAPAIAAAAALAALLLGRGPRP